MSDVDPQLQRWWEWYSQALSFSRAQSEWNWIQRIASETQTSNPVISVQVASVHQAVAGYCVLSAGALAIHGGITQRLLTSTNKLSDIQLVAQDRDLRAVCLERLILESFERRSELYQALTPLEKDSPEGIGQAQDYFERAGMFYLTKLVRMETQLASGTRIHSDSASDKRLEIETYQSVPLEEWVRTMENTYANTDDVPELADLRSTPKAIEGYRANRTPGVEGWFLIRCEGQPAGCLVLARHYHPTGEISYLGLIPEFRGQGYSFGIMQFAMNWMASQQCTKVALAVDCRNEVAIGVYQKWGFQATISYHAWVASPKTFQPSYFH
jgi:RimJ/RimL family protein N-acetyltransferase